MQGVTEPCQECAFDPHALGTDQLGPELERLAAGYATVITEASESNCPALSSRPSAEVWSILEYVGHIEFIYDFVGEMCAVAGEDELGEVNGVDPDEHVDSAGFNDVDAAEMSTRIQGAGERARTAIEGLPPEALGWKLSFNGNAVPLGRLTVAMVHESHHHLRDVSRLAAG